MYKLHLFPIVALVSLVGLSGCAATGGVGQAGSGTVVSEPSRFPSHFSYITKDGNYDVNNPRLAEGKPDGRYAVVETHGSLSLDIGSGLTFYDGAGVDVSVHADPDREVNYTVHVQHAGDPDGRWTEIGRGYGPDEFDFHAHDVALADFVQIRNEGSEPLHIDAVQARYVGRD